jgi:hypothetical protein
MSNEKNLRTTLIAAAAAIVMSTVSVGSAVGPAQAVASPTSSIARTLNA